MLRSVGRFLGGGGGGTLVSTKAYYYNNKYNNIISQTSWNINFTLSQISQIRSKHFEADGAPVSALPKNDSDKGEEVEKEKHIKKGSKKIVTKVGDAINLTDLFSENRVYLVRNIDKQQVKAEHLAGKVIVLLFAPRCVNSDRFQHDIKLLMDVYNELQPKGFEVVFIAPDKLTLNPEMQISAQEFVDREFSWMPWASIPYSDRTSRLHVQRNLGVFQSKEELCTVYVIDPTGLVLQRNLAIFETYGALGYPFTNERIEFLVESEYDAIIKRPSLKKLLGSRQRDFVITNKGEKVPIRTLEHKVVAIFFHEAGIHDDYLIGQLEDLYKELSKIKGAFEVVMIPDNQNKKSFWEEFKTMPWLAIPFEDVDLKRKLKRIFEFFPEKFGDPESMPKLVIFGRQGEFVEPLGANILVQYGVAAYPFTRKKVAELETEKVKALKLKVLWKANTIFIGKDGSQVPVSQFAGKKVVIFVERFDLVRGAESLKTKFVNMLKDRYIEMKGTVNEFEVIHILDTNLSTYPNDISRWSSWMASMIEKQTESNADVEDIPWMVFPEGEVPASLETYFLHRHCFPLRPPGCYSFLLAFNEDGRLVRRTFFPTVEDVKFPFYTGSLEDEALAQLNSLFGWNYWDYYPNKGRIYSVKDKLVKVSALYD